MLKQINVLFVTETIDDYVLIHTILNHGGFNPVFKCISTLEELKESITNIEWEIILVNNTLPVSLCTDILKILDKFDINIPLFLVSNDIDDGNAYTFVESADDKYFVKCSLTSLIPALKRRINDLKSSVKQKSKKVQHNKDHAIPQAVYTPDQTSPLENIDDGIIVIQKRRIRYVNKEFIGLTNYDLADLIGKDIFEIIPEEYRKKLLPYIQIQDKDNKPIDFDFPIIKKDSTQLKIYLTTLITRYQNKPAIMLIIKPSLKATNAQLAQQIQHYYILLNDIGNSIKNISTKEDLFQMVCDKLIEHELVDVSWIGYINKEKNLIESLAYKIKKDSYKDSFHKIQEHISTNKSYLSKETINKQNFSIIQHTLQEDKTDEGCLIKDCIFKSCGAFPIWSGKNLSSIIFVHSTKAIFFDEEIIELFNCISRNISISLTILDQKTKKIAIKPQKGSKEDIYKKYIGENDKLKKVFDNTDKSFIPISKSEGEYTLDDIYTNNQQFNKQLAYLPKIAESDSTILIIGETGTGKELVTSAIKNLSTRKDKPFIIVNCSALPDTLLESELFGYTKGAFTGAIKDKIGLLKAADTGTLFLDEIGDITPSMQVKILRVLQNKSFTPVGSVESIKIDIRFICATNKNLEKLVKEGTFRQDLFYRLNVVNINIPPLRDRKDDVPVLVSHFINKFNHKFSKEIQSITPEALNVLMNYPYPGNVRELENIIEYVFVFCDEKQIEKHYLPIYILESNEWIEEVTIENPIEEKYSHDKDQLVIDEKSLLIKALEINKWKRKETAKYLQIHPATLWRKMKKNGLL